MIYTTPLLYWQPVRPNDSQYNPLPWVYHPMVFSKNNHPITANIEASRFQFTNAIDTLSNAYEKTILLTSSPLSKAEGTPKQISLDILNIPPDSKAYGQGGNLPLAVLIEGEFTSAYTNRVQPIKLNGTLKNGSFNKMLVVADGDIIKNQLRQGIPLPTWL